MIDLRMKVALVTGASRGIGRATALALADAGARVLVHYGQSTRDAETVVTTIRERGGEAEAVGGDLSTADGPGLLSEKVRAQLTGPLDILVLNAGVSKAAVPFMEYTVDDIDTLFATNVRGPFLLLQQLVPELVEGSNVVVVTSLVAKLIPGIQGLDKPSILAYASTKGALETLVKNWAAMLGPIGIRVNAVAPGIIDTDMSNFTKTEAGRQVALSMQALKRLGKPEDVADVITFLASDRARWITGSSIPVDGGSKL